MKKQKTHKIIAFLMTIILAVALSACSAGKTSGSTADGGTGTNGKLFEDDTELNITIPSNVSWPYDENWALWRYLKEAVGGKIQIDAIPSTDFDTKFSLMLASADTMPDLLWVYGKYYIDNNVSSGAFISIDDNMDKLPNYDAFWNSLPEEERTARHQQRMSGDGKVYLAPQYGQERVQNHFTWLYRKDIFEKHDLTPPDTWEELYQVSEKLKELYPDSYPLSIMPDFSSLHVIGPQWKSNYQYGLHYDFKNKAWSYGATEQTMYDIIMYFRKMHSNGLIAPDFLSMNINSWNELVMSDRGFIMPVSITYVDMFNREGRANNPDYAWEVMQPPLADEKNGERKVMQNPPWGFGYAVCNTRNQIRIDNALKFLDWLYTDQAIELLSWGKEGETYEYIGEEKYFILDNDETPRLKYGAVTHGLHQCLDPAVSYRVQSEEQNRLLDQALSYEEAEFNPMSWMAFTEEETREINDLRIEIDTFTNEMISKFFLNLEPMSKWDSFQQNLKEMQVDKLVEIVKNAHERLVRTSE